MPKLSSDPCKLTRLCWNTQFWRQPSGPFGKSTNDDTYECQNGFGHEEWLFDITRTIDGWKYGFVQAVRPIHAGNTYDVRFYTLNGQDPYNKSRWLVAHINELEVLNQDEIKAAYRLFRQNGWIEQMRDDLKHVGIDPQPGLFSESKAAGVVNVRYRPASLRFFDPIDELAPRKSDRYKLFNWVASPNKSSRGTFLFKPGTANQKGPSPREFSAAIAVPDELHNRLQSFLYDHLNEMFGSEMEFSEEQPLPRGRSIDLVGRNRKTSKLTMYEIKTAIPARQAIREAMGQLLEYAYHPEGDIATTIAGLVIVGSAALTGDDQQYLIDLRQRTSLPIYYQHCDLSTGQLSERK